MVIPLVTVPFTLRMPAHAVPRLFGRRRATLALRSSEPAPNRCTTATFALPRDGDTGAWTAEEQDFLRALREAGL